MVKRYGVFIGRLRIEYRRYAFGGVYLVIGRKWITLNSGKEEA